MTRAPQHLIIPTLPANLRQRQLLQSLGLGNDPKAEAALASVATDADLQKLTLALGQTQEFAFSYNADPALQGWYPMIAETDQTEELPLISLSELVDIYTVMHPKYAAPDCDCEICRKAKEAKPK